MRTAPRLSAAVVALALSSRAQTLVRTVNGPAANAQYGKACIVVPDQNADGYKDLLVGAPGFNQERGAIYCLSGAYLATGTGTQTLWTCAPTANPGDLFGTAIAEVGDATGDGANDFLVGQPGYDSAGLDNRGAIRLVSGSSHAVVSLISGVGQGERMGSSIAAMGDMNYDDRTDVLVGCPGTWSTLSRLLMFSNSTLSTSGLASALHFGELLDFSGAELGASLAAGFGYADFGATIISGFIAGAPGFDAPGAPNVGKVVVGRVIFTGTAIFSTREYISSTPGERLGTSVDAVHDYDGDGSTDFVVGAPNSPNGTAFEVGRAVVLSGARVLAQTPPYEIYALPYGASVTPPVNHSDPEPDFHFGAAVRACADLNNDGVGELIVGAPDCFTPGALGGWNFRGLVKVFSGATGEQLIGITGASTDKLGDGIGGAIQDFDGDGFAEFVIAGSRSDVGGTDSGVLKCYRLFPVASSSYCTGKINSLGCTPVVSFSGTPSANSGQSFAITGSNFLNQKNGLLFYGRAPTAVLFQGGTKCVANPIVRTMSMNSGGATSGSSCTGVYSFDFNDWIQNGWDVSLTAGAEIYAQYWSRDPASASHTSLSNAVRFVVHP